MKYLGKRTIAYSCLLIVFMFSFSCNVMAQSNDLFHFVASTQAERSQSLALQGKVTYPIAINKQVSALAVGQELALPLPNGKSLELEIDKKWFAPNGDIQMTGGFGNGGSAVITFGKNVVFANFSDGDQSYGISLDESGQPFLIDHKASTNTIDLGDDILPPPSTSSPTALDAAPQTASAATAGNKAIVTLLAVYSREFANGFSGNPVTRINQMIAFTNAAYVKSGVHIDLRLAHAQQIAFNNGASIGTLLNEARRGTNAFTGLHALRDNVYADMVSVLPFNSGNGVAGVAYIGTGRDTSAFSVSQFAIWGSDSVFAHELGHNLGSGHERISANINQRSACTGGFTGHSCGHGNNGDGNGGEGTIMSYLDDRAWGFVFSNPSLNCQGEPCGIPKGQTNAADNRLGFNVYGPLIERFRVDNTNDDDKDGIKNDVDNCPNHPNRDQLNTDGDAQGDVCDNDDDNDGVNDGADNCRLIHNPSQEDSDGNGEGDACQIDPVCTPITSQSGAIIMVCL